jgi:endo-1,4-beta-xylanase
MRVSLAVASLAAFGIASASPIVEKRQAASGINAALIAKGKQYFGTSLTIRNDQSETNIIKNKNEFGSVTPENSMKWDATEPNRGQFNYGGGDQVANFASQNGMQLRCHTLVWHSQLPSWVSNGGFNNATLQEVMRNHINNVMGRWKGKCTHWDVVNEALEENGSYRNSVFYRVIGEAFIPIAFRMAAQADPNAKLYYNDYNLEYAGAKAEAAARIVAMVKAYGLRIDGVGLQAHLTTEKTPTNEIPTPSVATLEKALRLYTDQGVDVAYTELDIRMLTPENSSKLQTAAEHYVRVFESCMNVPRCIGVTVWGVSDKYSWVPGTFSGEGSALLWNNNYGKKPAYTAVLNFLNNYVAPTNPTA